MPHIITRIAGKKAEWLVTLRWIAVICVVTATYISSEIFHLPIRKNEIYLAAIILFLLNVIYLFLNHKIKDGTEPGIAEQTILVFQIVTDLFLLTFLLHFSGGVENPFIIYYIFHMMIASILLSKRTAYLLTTYALFLVAILAFMEYFAIIPHYPLAGFLKFSYFNQPAYLAGTGFVFVTTSYIVVYITSAIVARLKEAENSYRLANIQLEEKDKIKDEYVYRLSHDIKGHIAAIQNSLDASLMIDDPQKARNFSQTALRRAESLTGFIKNLLRITRLRLNKESEVTGFSLKEVIDEILLFNRENIEKKHLSVQFHFDDRGDMFRGNRFSIGEALTNLISNAIKYTREDGMVNIRVDRGRGFFLIEIEDNGIGIPESEKGNIFKEFFRAKNAAELQEEGDGLGLAIAKQIIDNHRGKISVQSEENKGTKFSIKLPA
ncbi:MAG: HAMP domain-containing histidine kinase [Bacteroidales bacterium]|nr:HAMP domain-containing histidine kinase [Bacteroidales bacterium]